jgi:hypothetical protein
MSRKTDLRSHVTVNIRAPKPRTSSVLNLSFKNPSKALYKNPKMLKTENIPFTEVGRYFSTYRPTVPTENIMQGPDDALDSNNHLVVRDQTVQ